MVYKLCWEIQTCICFFKPHWLSP